MSRKTKSEPVNDTTTSSTEETDDAPPSKSGGDNRGVIMMNLRDLKEKKIADLIDLAKEFNVEGAAGMRRQELIFSLLNAQSDKNGMIFGEGILEILPDG